MQKYPTAKLNWETLVYHSVQTYFCGDNDFIKFNNDKCFGVADIR